MKQRWIFGGTLAAVVAFSTAAAGDWPPAAPAFELPPAAPVIDAPAAAPAFDSLLAAQAGTLDAAVPLAEFSAAHDAALLVADRSPWIGATGAPATGMLRSSAGYPFAGPTNGLQGDDAVAAALRQPVTLGALPAPANWLSMILGMALVAYSLRRRGQLPSVAS
jgi:hypothetical protein